jgi:hypothetical protein
MFHAKFVYFSCIADIYVYCTLEPTTNSYVAPYAIVFFERKHCVSHFPLSYYPYPCI